MTGRWPRRIVVAGTDTDVGKTVFAAALVAALDGYYWKPVQAGYCEPETQPTSRSPIGAEGEAGRLDTDRETVLRLSGLPADRILPEAYRLKLPAAPSIAAAAEGLVLERDRLERLPTVPDGRPLVIELAGGLLVPMAPGLLQIDLVRAWLSGDADGRSCGNGVVLVARTALGTINHTLLSLEALRARGLAIAGVAFVGEPQPATEAAIVAHGGVRRLGRLPRLDRLEAASLAATLAANFDLSELRT